MKYPLYISIILILAGCGEHRFSHLVKLSEVVLGENTLRLNMHGLEMAGFVTQYDFEEYVRKIEGGIQGMGYSKTDLGYAVSRKKEIEFRHWETGELIKIMREKTVMYGNGDNDYIGLLFGNFI